MATETPVDSCTELRAENLESLRRRAQAYFLQVNRPVPSRELAEHLFTRKPGESIAPLMIQTLLGRDRRFHRTRPQLWELAHSPYRNLRLDEAAFTVVDLEATGSQAGLDRIIEVGMVRVEGNRIRGTFSSLVNPLRPIPRWIRHLTGIEEAMLQDAPRFHQIAPRILDLLRDSVFVAHNVDFDYPFLRAQLERSGHRPPPMPQLCTVRLSRRLHPEWGRFRLSAVASRLSVPLREHHRALSDALATSQIFLRELREMREEGIVTVGDALAVTWSNPQPGAARSGLAAGS